MIDKLMVVSEANMQSECSNEVIETLSTIKKRTINLYGLSNPTKLKLLKSEDYKLFNLKFHFSAGTISQISNLLGLVKQAEDVN